MIRVKVACFMLLVQACVAQPAQADSLMRAVGVIAATRINGDERSAGPAIETIRSELRIGDAEAWARLWELFGDKTVPFGVRCSLAAVIVQRADTSGASEIVRSLCRWIEEPLAPGSEWDGAKFICHAAAIEHLETSPHWRPLGDQPQTLALLGRTCIAHRAAGETANRALRLIARSGAPGPQRQAVAIDIVASLAGHTSLPQPLFNLLDESSIPALRALVSASGEQPEQFHFGAVSALAHLGDMWLLPELEGRRPQFRAVHKHMEELLDGYIQMVRMQHPPTGLTEFIAAERMYASTSGVEWAARRAVALGVPAADVRRAILTYAASAPTARTIDHRTGAVRDYGTKPLLSALKAACIELGVLSSDDLPDVPALPHGHGC